jgi:tRNA A-37 threonylcarbamoyl transferase component Bud32
MIREQLAGDRYRIERTLGAGGMGAVYQVLDESTGQRLALKRLHAAGSTKHAELFEREYQTLASLHHPRIVRVFEYGVDEAGPFYTMELLEGSDLSERAPMAWREVCACLRDAASILGLLHARRLVHRDLSPRNLWLTPDARLKLLDFGALAPFGPAREIVGTPAFVAPEALAGRALDQRTDLFALGALGYWLLTSTHAYRASRLDELRTLWKKPPAAASRLAKLVRADGDSIPVELDRLLERLLRLEADERPASTAEVVDQLNAIADLTPEAEDVVVQGYLESSAFVGRERERDGFAALLIEAQSGKPQALVIEGPEGIGRTRLLGELAMDARIRGAAVISVSAIAGSRPYDVAIGLSRELVKALPGEAPEAAKAQAAVLGALSPALRSLLGQAPPQPSAGNASAERVRKQAALSGWFLALAKRRALVVMVDDLHEADEESQAFLAALARAGLGHRLMLVAAVCTDTRPAHADTLKAYLSSARTQTLASLAPSETRELLRSVFGEVPYLERLAVRLHQLSSGSPRGTLMLARQLVRVGAARYAEGAWNLPTEVPTDLPATPLAAMIAALENVPPLSRRLAQLASVAEHGVMPIGALGVLVSEDSAAMEHALALLVEQRLLHQSDAGVLIPQRELREALRAELTAADRARTHRAIADLFAQDEDLISQARCGLHLVHAAELARGEATLLAVCRRIMSGEHEPLRAAAPMLSEALQLLRGAGREDIALIPLLSTMAVAGYQVDRKYATHYGEDALRALQRALHFHLAHRLRPWLGAKLTLVLLLAASSLGLSLRGSPLGTFELISWLVAVLGYLMGPATLCLDAPKLRRYAAVFEPLLALGSDHGVALVHRFCTGVAATTEDRSSEAHGVQQRVIERLQHDKPVSGMTEQNRRNLLGAALYSDGIRRTWVCDARALAIAAKLDTLGPMNAMQADHLRALYHAQRGELTQAAHYEQRVELDAIQRGTAWQAELLAPRHQMRLASWTHDLVTNKRAARTLAALVQEAPSFASTERRARAADLVLRRRYQEALPLLELDEPPPQDGTFVFMRWLLAIAYNGLGEHGKARALCLDELSKLTDQDRAFVILNLPIEGELALANAHLGSEQAAAEQLDSLLTEHASKGALVLGYLHRMRARIALLARELDLAEQHITAMESCYRPLRVPSLFVLCDELREALRCARDPNADTTVVERPGPDAHLLTCVELIMTGPQGDLAERSRAALQIALDAADADRGFVLDRHDGGRLVSLGTAVSEDVVAWARARLEAPDDADEQTVAVPYDTTLSNPDLATFAGVEYRVTMLFPREDNDCRPVAALVLGSASGQLTTPPTATLRLIGERITRSRTADRTLTQSQESHEACASSPPPGVT